MRRVVEVMHEPRYDICSTTVVLNGEHTWSWSAVIVVWLADTQKGGGGPMVNDVHCI